MRVLITGISGFVGLHLSEHLLADHPEVELYGLRRWRSEVPAAAALRPSVRIMEGDLLDTPSLIRVLQAARPDVIFHLAASSSVASSWDTPAEMMQVNALGTLHLLEAVRQLDLDARVVLACSAESYGLVRDDELPIREEQPFRPVSPYAVSKATVDLLGFQYFQTFRLRTIRMRLFNHCGPRQSARFVISSLARQLAEIEAGLRPPRIQVGNLEVRRDFVDVRDAARAYWLAATRGEPGTAYNVASGRAHSIREVVDHLLSLSDSVVEVEFDPSRLRPSELDVLVGDASRFSAATGWSPAIPFEQTLADTLAYWRGAVRP
ncbi:MAG TPA: GDP-mannose 4,6-dehydratase [Thermoanaerobaculaceae bacterium]|nr:GDP-mannose 4,6-dehydratase [Thermoanaerobaculaceae bacterium]